MRVLVTGHAGYIGAVTVAVLKAANHEVVGLDSGLYRSCGFGQPALEIPEWEIDIRDVQAADLGGFDAVIHLAALCNDPLGDLDPELTMEINYRASVRLARLARDQGVRRFLFSSSCSIYGANTTDDLLTEEAPLHPLTAYAESKVRAEVGIALLADDGFSPVFLRNATAYGSSPRLRGDVVLNNLVGWAYTTGKIRIMSDGSPWRPLVHVEDIARAFVACLGAPREAIHNQAFNVGRQGGNYQVRDLAEIARQTVPGATVEFAGEASPDRRDYRVDFSKVKRVLPEFQPVWDARAGAAELYAALQVHGIDREAFLGPRFTRLGQIRRLREAGMIDSRLRWTGEGARQPTLTATGGLDLSH